jgi:LCP family protein required for cell wall assembly
MNKKKAVFIVVTILLVWGALAFVVLDFAKEKEIEFVNPIVKIKKEITDSFAENKKENTVFESDIINVLLVGIDTSEGRRTRGQGGFNTDIMILASANPRTNRILLTSVPRDLWINGNKINALYTLNGEDSLVDAFEKVTGQQVDGVIRADFDHFTWLIDAFGGVPVEIQKTFTDSSFPNNSDSGPITVTFTEGNEVMGGERALTFARSRKGNNGEGSDLMRAKRQHLILQGMIKAISQPESIFWPMNIEHFYNLVTAPGKMQTTLTLSDVKYLWDYYKDRNLYQIESFVVDCT